MGNIQWEKVKKATDALIKIVDDAVYWKPPEGRDMNLPAAIVEISRIIQEFGIVPICSRCQKSCDDAPKQVV